MALSNIARMVRRKTEINPADKFLNELIRTIQANQRSGIPSKTYKPSSMGGCSRSIYYEVTGAPLDGTPEDYSLTGICESGTSRHETLQNYVMKMKDAGFDWEWIDPEQYVKEHNIPNMEVIERSGNEVKFFNSFYNMRFLCDGILRCGEEYYILEIKTESCYKFDKHEDAWKPHKMQATCYSLCFNIDKVIFLYENRDNCSKKTHLVIVTDEMKDEVEEKIAEIDMAIDEGFVPPKQETATDCQYCDYKRQCRRDG